jgi:hypothetical protein
MKMTADCIDVSCRFHQTSTILQVHSDTVLPQPVFVFTVVRQHLVDQVSEGSLVVQLREKSPSLRREWRLWGLLCESELVRIHIEAKQDE